MKYSLVLREEIEFDLADGIDWYEHQSTALGQQFRHAFDEAIAVIEDRPLSIAETSNGLRPYQMKRFPYLIHFRVRRSEILIVAVMRATRDDSAFENRE